VVKNLARRARGLGDSLGRSVAMGLDRDGEALEAVEVIAQQAEDVAQHQLFIRVGDDLFVGQPVQERPDAPRS
jgi:hypothetical protein